MSMKPSTRARTWGPAGWLAGSASIALGVFVVTLGFTLDRSWWDSKSFGINIVSAFAGALFGIPFAVFILFRITASQTDRSEWLTTQRLLVAAVSDLVKVTRSPLPESYAADFLSHAIEILSVTKDRAATFKANLEKQYPFPGGSNVVKIDKYDLRLEARHLVADLCLAQGWLEAVAVSNLGRSMTVAGHRWRFLDTYIRPRVLDADRLWLRENVYVESQLLFGAMVDWSRVDAVVRENLLEEQARFLEEWASQGELNRFGLTGWDAVVNLSASLDAARYMLQVHFLSELLQDYVNFIVQ